MMLTPGWPKPLGMDVVGTVVEVGERVTGHQVGDLVWGSRRNPTQSPISW